MNAAALLLTAGATTWAAVYTMISGVALARAARRGLAPGPTQASDVLLVRPCTGDDATLEPALRSTASLKHRGSLQVLFTVDSPADPAWPIVRRAASWLRERGVCADAVVAPTFAYNRKVGQLAEVTRLADADIVMCVDADVDLSGFDLDVFVTPLRTGTVGAVWAPPVEVGALEGWGDRASAAVLGASMHAFSLLGELDEGGLVGKTFAVRTEALHQVGGFDGLTEHLGEDMELAKRLRARGWPTAMRRMPVRAMATGRSLEATLARYTRWLWVIRAQRPSLLASYPLLLAAAPLLLALLLVLSTLAPAWALGLGALVMVTRVGVAVGAAIPRGRVVAAASYEWLLADIVLLIAFVRALGRPEVTWRGRTLRLGDGGRLAALEPSPDGA
ncbi:MAG: glycosyltransferase [Nannocystaceae bacterium]|nr:glycosyltransferase [bacterium]